MRDLELALKAAADPTRTRILKLLEGGPLCVCQVQAVLGLAASTVSKHLTLLKAAGLVEERRDGKWIEHRLASRSRNPHARRVLGLLRGALERDAAVTADQRRLRAITVIPREELCALPRRPAAAPRLAGRGR